MRESWRRVKGYPYKVSSKGRVKSLDRMVRTKIKGINVRLHKGKDLKPSIDNVGYPVVTLGSNGQNYRDRVHRLVAKLFIPNPLNKTAVNHIDGNKQNNCVENLEWVTDKENYDHAVRTGLARVAEGEGSGGAKLKNEEVLDIRYLYHVKGWSTYQIAKKYKMDNAAVWRVASGKNWKHLPMPIKTRLKRIKYCSISFEKILEMRKKYTIVECAKLLNVSTTSVKKWQNGTR